MSSPPVTMAEVAGPVPAPLHSGIPDEIVVWEILVRLPPEDLLRCRAVCPAWRRATSTRDFLLAHHSRQPSLPIVYHYEFGCNFCENLIALDHRSGADTQLQHVARFDEREIVGLEASCDGLLVHADSDDYFSICNPATHQYAPLPQLYGFNLFGMYRHSPTGEYRLLLRAERDTAYYVFTLGSSQPPRHIEYPEAEEARYNPLSVLLHGNLQWLVDAEQHVEEGTSMIMVFDTTAELFRQMPAPPVSGYAQLFEMGDMLSMACFVMTDKESANKTIDVFVMKDYGSQVWAFKCRIELQVEEISMHCQNHRSLGNAVVMPADGVLLVLVYSQDCVHHLDINGKLVASFYCGGLSLSKFRLKQTLVPHTLFSSLESYVMNDSPFI